MKGTSVVCICDVNIVCVCVWYVFERGLCMCVMLCVRGCVCVCVCVTKTMSSWGVTWMGLLPLLSITSCISTCKMHYLPFLLYRCALRGQLELETAHQ